MPIYKVKFKNVSRYMVDVCYPGGRRLRKCVNTKKQAEALETTLKQEIFENKWLIRFQKNERFNVFLKKYYPYIESIQAVSTYQTNVRRIKKHIVPYFGNLTLPSVTKQRIDNYLNMRKKQGAKPNTIRIELACLSHIFNTAISWKMLFVNPVSQVDKPKIPKLPPRYLTDEEAQSLLDACPEHLYPIVLTALHTGMRRSELLNLRWVDVEFDKRHIVVRSNDGYHTKDYDYRFIGITDTLFKVLYNLPKYGEYVFTYHGERIKDVKRSLRAAYQKAKLSYGGLHILRHTFATNLIKKGVELEKIRILLGHSEFTTTLKYAHLSSRSVTNEVFKLDN